MRRSWDFVFFIVGYIFFWIKRINKGFFIFSCKILSVFWSMDWRGIIVEVRILVWRFL